jgi:hypothetical protein
VAFSKRIFEEIFNGIEAFLKGCNAFLNYFQINEGFYVNGGRFERF